ncbi:MAG: glycerol-3-phosphate 1-O-acyltransferase PlsY [Methylocystaceae bacterium]
MAAKVGLIILCYFLGSIPFSYLVPKTAKGVDIRQVGSGNVGATNVLRNMGWLYGILAMLLDIAKGVLAAYIGVRWGGSTFLTCLCAGAVVLGHCYSPFLKFVGGKGVATAGGVVIYLMPLAAVILVIWFVLVVAVKRYVSLGSVLTAAALPLAAYLNGQTSAIIWLCIILAAFVIYKHRPNNERLLKGTEPRLGKKVGES